MTCQEGRQAQPPGLATAVLQLLPSQQLGRPCPGLFTRAARGQVSWGPFSAADSACGGCRYGYQSSDYYTYVLDQYAQANIPLETFVADSQYMNMSQIWTLGSNFSVPDMKVRGQPHAPPPAPEEQYCDSKPCLAVTGTGHACSRQQPGVSTVMVAQQRLRLGRSLSVTLPLDTQALPCSAPAPRRLQDAHGAGSFLPGWGWLHMTWQCCCG